MFYITPTKDIPITQHLVLKMHSNGNWYSAYSDRLIIRSICSTIYLVQYNSNSEEVMFTPELAKRINIDSFYYLLECDYIKSVFKVMCMSLTDELIDGF